MLASNHNRRVFGQARILADPQSMNLEPVVNCNELAHFCTMSDCLAKFKALAIARLDLDYGAPPFTSVASASSTIVWTRALPYHHKLTSIVNHLLYSIVCNSSKLLSKLHRWWITCSTLRSLEKM